MSIEIRHLSIKSSVADDERERRDGDGDQGDPGDPGVQRDTREDGEWRATLRRQWQELQELRQER